MGDIFEVNGQKAGKGAKETHKGIISQSRAGRVRRKGEKRCEPKERTERKGKRKLGGER